MERWRRNVVKMVILSKFMKITRIEAINLLHGFTAARRLSEGERANVEYAPNRVRGLFNYSLVEFRRANLSDPLSLFGLRWVSTPMGRDFHTSKVV
jgi:hypothetical protein